jgi:hypothetical protein
MEHGPPTAACPSYLGIGIENRSIPKYRSILWCNRFPPLICAVLRPTNLSAISFSPVYTRASTSMTQPQLRPHRHFLKLSSMLGLGVGKHFVAWEQPQAFTEELRTAFRSLRQ